MIFAKVDLVLLGHSKAYEVGPEAMGLWLWGLLHARDQQTDGELGRAAVVAAWGGKGNQRAADKLVLTGLWEVTESGWRVCKYAEKNDTKADIAERQRLTAERKSRSRSRSCPVDVTRDIRVPSGSGSGSLSLSLSGELTDQSPRQESEAPSGVHLARPFGGVPRPHELEYRAAFEGGMRELLGLYAHVWGSADQGALNQVVATFGAPRRGSKLHRWIHLAAMDYAEFVRSKGAEARYWPLDPRGMLRFLRDAQLVADARAAP